MSPRLILLTGPAAGEVADVFREMCYGQISLSGPTGVCGIKPQWDEVRDYWSGLRAIATGMLNSNTPYREEIGNAGAPSAEFTICSLPGGEAWLVGLALPDMPVSCKWGEYGKNRKTWEDNREAWGAARKTTYPPLPARLAILAPSPPPLLVERVRAWDGEVWAAHPTSDCEYPRCSLYTPACKYYHDTWPEAVRAALGEVAP